MRVISPHSCAIGYVRESYLTQSRAHEYGALVKRVYMPRRDQPTLRIASMHNAGNSINARCIIRGKGKSLRVNQPDFYGRIRARQRESFGGWT